MSAIETNQLFNFIQGSDINGVSSYDIWKSLNPNGTEAEFLAYIRSGPQGEKGEPGSSARVYFLVCSDNVIKKNLDNTLLPSTITFGGFYREGANAARIPYAGRFVIQETTDGVVWKNQYTSVSNEESIQYTPSSNDVKIIKCRLFSADDTSVEIDAQSVVILSDVENIEIGARNILAQSDIRYEITKDSNPVLNQLNIVDTFDLQRLVGKTVCLSYYVNTSGSYTNADDATQESSNKFGIISKVTWSDSTGVNTETITQPIVDFSAVGVNKERVSTKFEVIAPEGYDTIDDFVSEIQLTLKPDSANDSVWVFERPKLELGKLPTEWSIAPEDIENVVITLSNEAHTIATDHNGDNGNFDGCETLLKVYSGINEVTDKASYVINTSAGVTGNWDETNYTYTISDLSVDTGYVDFEVTYNRITVVKRFTVAKIKSGSSGESTYDIWKSLGHEGDASDFIEYLRGKGGLAMSLSNEAHVIVADENGENADFSGCVSYVQLYNGLTDVTNNATYEITTSEGVSGTWDESNHKYTVTGLITDNGYVDIKATINNVFITKRFSVCKSKSKGNDDLIIVDRITGDEYYISIGEGKLETHLKITGIKISKMPDKTEYGDTLTFDPTGMIVSAITTNGNERQVLNYTYAAEVTQGSNSHTITYTDSYGTYTAEVPITFVDLTEQLLQDFEYTNNGDGTYTIIDWKETLNGEPSTECVVPDNENIIL